MTVTQAKTKAKRTKVVASAKTRSQWAAEICADYKQSIDGILKIGRTLNAAKRALDHGEWLPMIEHDLPFSASMAQQFMKVASDRRIRNAARMRLLPAAVGSLFDLSRLSDTEFKQGLKSGAINPKMKRDDVKTVKVNVTHRTERLDVPEHIASTFKVTHSPLVIARPNYVETHPLPSVVDLTPAKIDVASSITTDANAAVKESIKKLAAINTEVTMIASLQFLLDCCPGRKHECDDSVWQKAIKKIGHDNFAVVVDTLNGLAPTIEIDVPNNGRPSLQSQHQERK